MPTDSMSFASHAIQNPDLPAVIDQDGVSWSRRDLFAAANRLSRALNRAGVRPGNTIAIVAPTCAEYLVVYFAVMQIGAYLVPLNWQLGGEELCRLVADCEPTVLVVHCGASSLSTESRLLRVPVKLSLGDKGGFVSLSRFLVMESPDPLLNPVQGSVSFYTSGTTGRPSLVKLSPGQHNPPAIRTLPLKHTSDGSRDVFLCAAPLYHGAGLMHTVTALHQGFTAILMARWQPGIALELICRHRVTVTFMVPTMFHRLLQMSVKERLQYDLKCLVQIVHGAAPCAIDVKLAMMEWIGPILWESYNGSEGQGTYADPDTWMRCPGTAGRPYDGGEVRILDEDGNELPDGEIGNIYIKDLLGCRFTYVNDPEKTARTRRGDFFTMGDTGFKNLEGLLFICDRRSDLINCGGIKIFPGELERLLLSHPAVADAAVIGVDDPIFGQVPEAFIQLVDGCVEGAEISRQILGYLFDKVSLHKIPRRVTFVATLPRGENGKLYKRALERPVRPAVTGGG